MEELTQEQIIENCINLGTMEIIEQEIVLNAMRTRITKARFNWESYSALYQIEYLNPVNSNSVYAVKSERRELI